MNINDWVSNMLQNTFLPSGGKINMFDKWDGPNKDSNLVALMFCLH